MNPMRLELTHVGLLVIIYHQIVLIAQISPRLSRHSSLSFIASDRLCCIATYAFMQNHNDRIIKTSDTVFLEKYTSPFIERVVCERELETEQNYNILTPTLMAISVSFPFFWVAQPGAWGPASLGASFLYRIFSPTRLIPKLLLEFPVH